MLIKQFKAWTFGWSTAPLILAPETVEQAQQVITDWSQIFPQENSWARQHAGVPSLCVRLDCTLNGHLNVYDIYPNANGLSLTKELNTRFSQIFDITRQDWPADLTAAGSANHSRYYGLKLGFWREVSSLDLEDLDWNNGFCLKSFSSASPRDVFIYKDDKNQLKKQGIGGASSFTKIRTVLEEQEKMYYQDYYQPMPAISPEKKLMVLRLFFLYSLSGEQYLYAGGLWNSRNNLRVHGARDACFGAVN
jgi:hypothetical protein